MVKQKDIFWQLTRAILLCTSLFVANVSAAASPAGYAVAPMDHSTMDHSVMDMQMDAVMDCTQDIKMDCPQGTCDNDCANSSNLIAIESPSSRTGFSRPFKVDFLKRSFKDHHGSIPNPPPTL